MRRQVKNCESILLACVDVDELTRQSNAHQMVSSLSDAEHIRANAFHDNLLRDRFIAGRFCLRQILGNELNIPANEISFAIESNGKPFIANAAANVGHFSFSRSHQYALIGYSKSNRIGVDTELIRNIPDMELMAAEIFTKDQLRDWNSLPALKKSLSFYRVWTRKEAVVKVDGRGISDGVRKIEVPIGDLRAQAARVTVPPCPAFEKKDTEGALTLTEWQPNDELVVSVASESVSSQSMAFSDLPVQRTGTHCGTGIRRSFYFAE